MVHPEEAAVEEGRVDSIECAAPLERAADEPKSQGAEGQDDRHQVEATPHARRPVLQLVPGLRGLLHADLGRAWCGILL